MAQARAKKLSQLTAAVVGIGRVGLPLALFLADKGFTVNGVDVDSQKVNLIAAGKMPFLEEGAPALLKKHLNKSFFVSSNFKNIAHVKIIILTLGTPVDENMNPSLVQIDKALELSRPYFRKGQLLILRSTVSPSTTAYVKSYLNDLKGIMVGTNFFLAFCPERIAEGRSLKELAEIPQIVGGVDTTSSKKAADFFENLNIEV